MTPNRLSFRPRAARSRAIAVSIVSADSNGFVLCVWRYSPAGTRSIVFSSTSFIGVWPSRRCAGRSTTATSGKCRAQPARIVGLSVSTITRSTDGHASSVRTTWWNSGAPPSGR